MSLFNKNGNLVFGVEAPSLQKPLSVTTIVAVMESIAVPKSSHTSFAKWSRKEFLHEHTIRALYCTKHHIAELTVWVSEHNHQTTNLPFNTC
eukprot:6315112-Amphidinium_carterae.1